MRTMLFRLVGAALLAAFAMPAGALDRPPSQVQIEAKLIEIQIGVSQTFGTFDLDTSFNNGESGSFSRSRPFLGVGIDVPVLDLGGPTVSVGGDARVFPDSTLVRRSFDMHPTNGNDVRITVSNTVQVSPFVAIDFPTESLLGDLARESSLRLLAGANIGDSKTVLDIDETGGGGNRERFVESTVSVAPFIGGEIVLGGLVQNDSVDVGAKLRGTVAFSDIPVLRGTSGIGNAYRSRVDEDARLELVIFVTPRILRLDEDD